jgi:hypothetical protein
MTEQRRGDKTGEKSQASIFHFINDANQKCNRRVGNFKKLYLQEKIVQNIQRHEINSFDLTLNVFALTFLHFREKFF